MGPRRSSGFAVVFIDNIVFAGHVVNGNARAVAWGWGTEDGARVLGYLKRFGSVTVVNGHIHQLMQKVEGNVVFHTARSTAFAQPQPGTAPSPGPMQVLADQLKGYLGITRVDFQQGNERLAIVDTALDDK